MERGGYNEVCEKVREETQAEAAFMVVIKGNNGTGFCYSTSKDFSEMTKVAEIFEALAAQVRKDLEVESSTN